jgi:hypothetical protein
MRDLFRVGTGQSGAVTVIESRHERTLTDDGSAEQEPALAALASAAVGGSAPAGPERRQRVAIALRDASGMQSASALSVAEGGFSLHGARFWQAIGATGLGLGGHKHFEPLVAAARQTGTPLAYGDTAGTGALRKAFRAIEQKLGRP